MDEYGQMTPQGGPGLAIASMVLGIIALVLSCLWYISIPCGLVGLILGGVALAKHTRGKGMAIAGLVCSIIAIGLVIIILAGLGAALTSLAPYM